MQFPAAVKSGFSNYVNFSGRASRSEYWYWVLFAFIVSMVAAVLDGAFLPLGPPALETASSIALFLPGLAVAVRRLHDRDFSGWWMLLAITLIGLILLIVWFCMRGTPGPNRFGTPVAS